MSTRRGFLAGLLAAGAMPVPTWADAGDPAYLSAAQVRDGSYVLTGLDAGGAERFRIPLPDRGHAAAAHPTRPEAVAFARRPGTFALVLDCRTGDILATLDSPRGRHFYGHGAFDLTGDLLFTTENDFDLGQGRIGVWDARNGYARVGEFASFGVGPHEMRQMPDGTLLVANGGIDTHPDTGREKLNLPTMRPNLSYVDLQGRLLEQIEPPQHHASVRHLSVRADGLVGIGMQWQGAIHEAPALVATHQRGGVWRDMGAGPALNGYVGSIAFSGDGDRLAVTSPKSGVVQVFAARTGDLVSDHAQTDVCGVAATSFGLMVTDGQGGVSRLNAPLQKLASYDLAFDNHLVAITAPANRHQQARSRQTHSGPHRTPKT